MTGRGADKNARSLQRALEDRSKELSALSARVSVRVDNLRLELARMKDEFGDSVAVLEDSCQVKLRSSSIAMLTSYVRVENV